MTPKEALIRGGHKHPDQILEDLERGGCVAITDEEYEVLTAAYLENALRYGGIDLKFEEDEV